MQEDKVKYQRGIKWITLPKKRYKYSNGLMSFDQKTSKLIDGKRIKIETGGVLWGMKINILIP